MASRYLIYGLCDPLSGALRYIGKSTSGLKRAKSHTYKSQLNNPQNRTRSRNWTKSLVNRGLRPQIEILEEVDSPDKLVEAERYWIAAIRATGAELLNHSDGGEGTTGRIMSVETRRKIGDKNRGRPPRQWSLEDRAIAAEKMRENKHGLGKISPKKGKRGISPTPEQIAQGKRTAKLNDSLGRKAVLASDGRVFPSITQAAIFYGISLSAVSSAMIKKYAIRKGVSFVLADKEFQRGGS